MPRIVPANGVSATNRGAQGDWSRPSQGKSPGCDRSVVLRALVRVTVRSRLLGRSCGLTVHPVVLVT